MALVEEDGPFISPPPSMLLRDYFAAQAMQGMLSSEVYQVEDRQLAREAYELADAMLEARGTARRTP